jgi:hypothetical protein
MRAGLKLEDPDKRLSDTEPREGAGLRFQGLAQRGSHAATARKEKAWGA